MQHHREIIGLVISYTIVGAFVFTVIISCLSLVGWIRFEDKRQQKKLFHVLIIEIVVACIGFFSGFMNLNAAQVGDNIRENGKTVGQLSAIKHTITSGAPFPSNTNVGSPSANPLWSPKSSAAANTYASLVYLKQIDASFESAGSMDVRDLRFSKGAKNSKEHKSDATALADALDKSFRLLDAKYERGANSVAAVKGLASVLSSKTNSLSKVAETVDQFYRFAAE